MSNRVCVWVQTLKRGVNGFVQVQKAKMIYIAIEKKSAPSDDDWRFNDQCTWFHWFLEKTKCGWRCAKEKGRGGELSLFIPLPRVTSGHTLWRGVRETAADLVSIRSRMASTEVLRQAPKRVDCLILLGLLTLCDRDRNRWVPHDTTLSTGLEICFWTFLYSTSHFLLNCQCSLTYINTRMTH